MSTDTIQIEMISTIDTLTFLEKKDIVDFLFQHLDKYGDKWEDIERAVDYATSNFQHQGGFILLAKESEQITGACVVLKTGMEGYIPANILVYIATHEDFRGKGIGKELMKRAINIAKGGIALHVEPDNPARFLYEKLGFTSKYLEMRYTK